MEKRKMITFPEIVQFRQIIKLVHDNTRYNGKDENGHAIYDATKRLPILTFKGTVKLHGTNAGVTLTKDGDMYAQSRENVITPTPKEVYVIEFEDGTTTVIDNLDDLKIGDIIDV